MAKQINISNEAVDMLKQIAGPQGSWSDKIVRVSTMSGHNGSYFIRQYLDTLSKIYPQFEDHFNTVKSLLLSLYRLGNNQWMDPLSYAELLTSTSEVLELELAKVHAQIKAYQDSIRNPSDN